MFWIGLIVTLVFSAGFLLKMSVIWNAGRCPHGGGGVPTLDFVLFYPIFLTFGIATMLASIELVPFRHFIPVLYVALLALTIFIHWLFNVLGERELQRQRGSRS